MHWDCFSILIGEYSVNRNVPIDAGNVNPKTITQVFEKKGMANIMLPTIICKNLRETSGRAFKKNSDTTNMTIT